MKTLMSVIFVLASLLMRDVCWADHDLDIYAFGNLFVFDTLEGSYPTLRVFNVVVLEDTTDLKIAGQVKTRMYYNVDGYAHYRNYLIVLTMNRVQIFNLQDPSDPELVRTFKLQKSEPYLNLNGIAQDKMDRKRFYLLSRHSAAELVMDEDSARWQVIDSPSYPELKHEDFTKSKFPRHDHSSLYPWPFVAKETTAFRYEVDWEVEETGRYSWLHKKYLRKVSKMGKGIVSSLLLGELLETGGE